MESQPNRSASNDKADETLPQFPLSETTEAEDHNRNNSQADEYVTANPIRPSRARRLLSWIGRCVSAPNLAEWCMVGVTVAISIIGYYQLRAMSGQLQEMESGSNDTHILALAAKKQADKAETISASLESAVQDMDAANSNAKKALNATIQQFRLEQRAWIVVKGIFGQPKLGQPWNIQVWFTNVGKTPAPTYRLFCMTKPAKDESALVFTKLPLGTANLMSPEELWGCTLHPLSTPKVTQEALDELTSKRETLFVYGSVVYTDIFGGSHWLKFCRSMSPDGSEWSPCKTNNKAGDGKIRN